MSSCLRFGVPHATTSVSHAQGDLYGRYLINVHDAETAQKRIPKEKLVSLDFVASSDLPDPLAAARPEESFNYAWVSAEG